MRKSLLLVLSFAFFIFLAHAQTIPVKGKVTDAAGNPVPGVSIMQKSTKTGTITDEQGNFNFQSKPNATLVISGLGYDEQQVKIPASGTLQITLTTDVKSLSEVVVTGVGVATSKRKVGISVESVTADKLPAAPTASIDQALIGKIPGAQISSISGNPGDPVNILLRGINTIQGGTKPLILLDGIEIRATDINSLDLSNIDRVEVVQGAASATIYGAQGANGAIQIFTKKGKRGATVVNFSTSYAWNSYINSGDVHKAALHPYLTDANNNIIDPDGTVLTYDQYGSIGNISYTYGGPTRYAILDPRNICNKQYNANLKYYDQFSEVFQTGTTLNNNINISGASEKSDFSLSAANNHTVSPVMHNGYLDRTNLTANLGTELFKGFKIRSVTELVYTKNTMVPGLGAAGGQFYGQGNTVGNVGNIYGFLNTSPFFDLRYKLGDGTSPAYQEAGDYLSINAFNPYYVQEYSSALDNKIDVIQNFDANYVVNKFVELDAKYGINFRTENSRWTYYNQSQNINSNFYETWHYARNGNDNTGEIDDWAYRTTFQNFLATATIRTDFQKDFHSKLPIQTSTQISFDYRKNKYTEYDTYGVGLPLFPPINMQATSAQAVYFDYVEPFITYGYLVNQKIDIGDWGGVVAGFRSDYSSAFGGGSKPFTFPHIAGYILPSSFNFWNGLQNAIPYFKLRAAYGEAGIQPGPFDRYPTLSPNNIGSGLAYSLPTVLNNPDLQVEVSKEFEAGTDFTVNINKGGQWFNSINGTFVYWKRKSNNVIYNVPIPLSTGAPSAKTNAIDMSSHGFQFQVNLPVSQSKNFSWDFTVNFGHETSVIDNITGTNSIVITSSAGSTSEVLVPGQKIGQIYGYKALTSLTELRQDGKTPYLDPSTLGQYAIVNGMVVDTALRQIIFTDETYPIGDPNPKFNMSFINSLTYKNFVSLSFQFDWVYGSHLYNQTKEWMYRDGISGDFEKPVTINGVTAAYTAYWASAYYDLLLVPHGPGNNATKDFFYEDASFVRLRNVSLAFDIAKIAKIKYFQKLQLIFTGRNILTFTKYTGFDPEISSGATNSSFDRGVDHSTIPNLKSYQIGLNVGF